MDKLRDRRASVLCKFNILAKTKSFIISLLYLFIMFIYYVYHETFKILGWCPAGSVLPHGEKVPL